MNVSLKWLSTLVDIKGLDAEEMAETLTIDGIPVEHVIYPGKNLRGVVTGEILSVDKHPDADRLLVCKVNVGSGKTVQIVHIMLNRGRLYRSLWMVHMCRQLMMQASLRV